jgi:predicted transcriptional regulator
MDGQNKLGHVLGELEIEVMNSVWASSEAVSVRDVVDQLNSRRKVAYTTVMTIMSRLVAKGILKQTQVGKAFVYEAVYSKDTFLAKVTKQIVKNLVANFGDVAIAHFANEVEKIPANKRQKLLEILKNKED